MILYLDTSALLKIFLPEPSSEFVVETCRQANSMAMSRVGYVECCSALGHRRRQGRLTDAEHVAARQALAERWPRIAAIELDEFGAGELAQRHGLRALDALHLAAALFVRRESRREAVLFCTFDSRQSAAARAEQFQVVPQL